MFKIEKSVPLTKGRNSYPFPQMEIGDSFALPSELRISVSNAATAWGKVNGRKFTVQRDGDQHRCWRVA